MKNILRNNNRPTIALLSIFLLSIAGCSSDENQKVDHKNWQLTWSDEFDGAAGDLPDNSKWAFDLGNNGGWGNAELETYTNSPDNVSMDGNGNLVITAIKNGNSFTSARITTKNKFTQAYGRFEARLKTPYGPGVWPAFWMLGDNSDTVSWPQCGEIDIMELRGQAPSTINGTIHGPGYSGGSAITSSYSLLDSRFDVDFHIFAVEWDADKIDFFVDDYLYKRISKSDVKAKGEWVYDHPFYLILNVAVGGNYVGFPTNLTPFPQSMTIDYVKVYN